MADPIAALGRDSFSADSTVGMHSWPVDDVRAWEACRRLGVHDEFVASGRNCPRCHSMTLTEFAQQVVDLGVPSFKDRACIVGCRQLGAVTRRASCPSGEAQLRKIQKAGCWEDGKKLGKGHGSACLKPEYGKDISEGRKSVEGRPCTGWAAKVRPDDWVNFAVNGGSRLVCRVLWVQWYPSFESMVRECTIEACLPGLDGSDVAAAVSVYHSFETRRGIWYQIRPRGCTGAESRIDAEGPCSSSRARAHPRGGAVYTARCRDPRTSGGCWENFPDSRRAPSTTSMDLTSRSW